MQVVGSRPSMLIMREAFYGTRRFDDFVHHLAVAPATASTHLRSLEAAGLLRRTEYREAKARPRSEYRLTQSGRDLLPAILALFVWGAKHAPVHPTVNITHRGCGAPATVALHCTEGHELDERQLQVELVGQSIAPPPGGLGRAQP
ncbi:winged helix-turn-helix transcriptional regulator [Arthrobacter sp. CAN_C5]|uniref:winged helix-turn-helix transcriptional regulator n=1 Tax=Arthrobacter sp. CAN_C5 TaxID=2760706 RepID=UPI0037BF919D